MYFDGSKMINDSGAGMVLESPKVLFTGRASDILEWRTALESAGVLIAITPEFPYSEDGQLLNGAVIG